MSGPKDVFPGQSHEVCCIMCFLGSQTSNRLGAMWGSLDRSVTLRPYPTLSNSDSLWSSAAQILFLNTSSWIGAPMAGCSCGVQKTTFLVSSLLPPWGSQESNSGHQIWWHGAEPSSRSTFFLNCIFCLWGPEIKKLFNSMRSLTCFL